MQYFNIKKCCNLVSILIFQKTTNLFYIRMPSLASIWFSSCTHKLISTHISVHKITRSTMACPLRLYKQWLFILHHFLPRDTRSHSTQQFNTNQKLVSSKQMNRAINHLVIYKTLLLIFPTIKASLQLVPN